MLALFTNKEKFAKKCLLMVLTPYSPDFMLFRLSQFVFFCLNFKSNQSKLYINAQLIIR